VLYKKNNGDKIFFARHTSDDNLYHPGRFSSCRMYQTIIVHSRKRETKKLIVTDFYIRILVRSIITHFCIRWIAYWMRHPKNVSARFMRV